MPERFQPIYDIATLCVKKKVRNAVLCPGSRNAPLTLAFARHPDIVSRTISDERSAAFVALGMGQQSGVPTALVCTSGTAVFNFAPAVAEAYFAKTPLLVLTADRPTEWIGQQDGQTIHQAGVFGKHVKKSYQLPQEYDHPDDQWAINRMVNEAINLSVEYPQGPVHLNVPFREPLYPPAGASISFGDTVRDMEVLPHTTTLSESQKEGISAAWASSHNVLIVAGQHPFDSSLVAALETFFEHHNVPLIGDVISNIHPIGKNVKHADAFLGEAGKDVKKSLRPDLLITFGGSVISKNLKIFLREFPAKAHWHIDEAGEVADTFQTITKIIRINPAEFFRFLSSIAEQESFENQRQNNFNKFWEVEERRALRSMADFFPLPMLAEFELVHEVLNALPERCNLHLANSMCVRYANYIGLSAAQKKVSVFSNRGTSGIDGCTSTAVGHSLTSNCLNILITGDLAFFYDRNAFWHNYPLPNFRIVVLNNHGGIIFKMLDGPESVPEAEEYFITRQPLNAKNLCSEFSFDYLNLNNRRKLKNLLKDFFDTDGRTKILELESDANLNKTIFEDLKEKIRKSYEG